jgi:CubicO group peptidase (beta-lactamase class C family)
MTFAHGQDWEAKLAAFAARFRTETKLPGISIATTVGGERACVAAGVGRDGVPLDAAARCELGCTAQLPLALLVLELACAGKLALEAPLAEYLRELRGSACGTAVRVAHLLSHTSGYCGTSVHDAAARRFDCAALLNYVRAAPQLFPPGAVYTFEHSGVALLGEIVRRVVGRPAARAVHDAILAPLGVTRRADAAAAGRCAGRYELDGQAGCFTAASDAPDAPPLSELWQPAFSPTVLGLGELLALAEAITDTFPRRAVERLTTPVVPLPLAIGGPLRELLPGAFGNGVACFRDGFCGSASLTRGQCVAVRFDVARRIGVAVGVNATVPYLRDLVLAAVCRKLGGRAPALARPPLPFALAELAGSYIGPSGGRVEAKLDGERLICEIGRDGSPGTLRGAVTVDAENRPVLASAAADLALAFFRVPQDGGVGLMLGYSAYKRVTHDA